MIKIPARVLIVDDEKDFVEIFAMRLEELGETVFSAFSGKECLNFLSENEDIDVVILDIKMPGGMDGIDTLMELKKRFPLVEVLLLTGHGTIETAVKGMKLGAYDYLLKPADFSEIKEKIEGARQRREEQEERIRKAEQRALLRKGGNIY
ncbi:MAG: response regulator [Thermodesulfobacteriota bacterium]|nr:response regulator [Thermodesulfobacteriota bacterium]